MTASFFKYQALGNDMVVIDPARFDRPLTATLIHLICDRHFGLGADGVCYGPLPQSLQPYSMRFFNPDGTEAEKSGNGLRIFARYLWNHGYVSTPNFEIYIQGEAIPVAVNNPQASTLTLTMGQLSFNSGTIPASGPLREVVEERMTFRNIPTIITAVTIGNPHCVVFTEHTLANLARTQGPIIETAPQFPNRTNVQFVQVVNQHTIALEIWERGAGYTLASGTSACAAAGAAIKTGRCISPDEEWMAGGSATVEVDANWRVTLTGTVEAVCSGTFSEDLLEKATM